MAISPQPPQPQNGLQVNTDNTFDVKPANSTVVVDASGIKAGDPSTTQQAVILKIASLRA